jgi:hypothetical protein
MSVYGRRKGLMDLEERHHAPVERSPATPEHGTGAPEADPSQDWSEVRRAYPADYVLPISEKWLKALPHGVVPIALIAHFPRIVNLIAMQWNDNLSCPAYFEELFADRRGNRQGFPQDVRRDLSRLRNYWYTRTTTLLD